MIFEILKIIKVSERHFIVIEIQFSFFQESQTKTKASKSRNSKRRIQNPTKHLRLSFLQKLPTVFNRQLFPQKVPP